MLIPTFDNYSLYFKIYIYESINSCHYHFEYRLTIILIDTIGYQKDHRCCLDLRAKEIIKH